jgi:hypothetical protein
VIAYFSRSCREDADTDREDEADGAYKARLSTSSRKGVVDRQLMKMSPQLVEMLPKLVETPPHLDVVPVLGVRVGFTSQMGVVSSTMT